MKKKTRNRILIFVASLVVLAFYLDVMSIPHALFWSVVFFFVTDFVFHKILT